MSIIARAGSTPEPSSAPERTVPVALPAAVPVKSESPALRAPLTVNTPTLAGSTVPSAAARHGGPRRGGAGGAAGGARARLAAWVEASFAGRGAERPRRAGLEGAVARVALALGR